MVSSIPVFSQGSMKKNLKLGLYPVQSHYARFLGNQSVCCLLHISQIDHTEIQPKSSTLILLKMARVKPIQC